MSNDFSNTRLVYVFGMRRSGNHAILTWLHGIQNQHSEHFNNQKPNKKLKWSPKTSPPRDLITVSYEEVKPLFSRHPLPNAENQLGSARYVKYVNILRDPLNLFASRFKHHSLGDETMRKPDFFIDCWKKYADWALNNNDPDVVNVVYNDWFESAKSRSVIASSLCYDFTHTDPEVYLLPEQVPDRTGGSSFSGKEYDGQATQMDVNNRYRLMIDHKKFHKFMRRFAKDKDAIRLAKQIFGDWIDDGIGLLV